MPRADRGLTFEHGVDRGGIKGEADVGPADGCRIQGDAALSENGHDIRAIVQRTAQSIEQTGGIDRQLDRRAQHEHLAGRKVTVNVVAL